MLLKVKLINENQGGGGSLVWTAKIDQEIDDDKDNDDKDEDVDDVGAAKSETDQ